MKTVLTSPKSPQQSAVGDLLVLPWWQDMIVPVGQDGRHRNVVETADTQDAITVAAHGATALWTSAVSEIVCCWGNGRQRIHVIKSSVAFSTPTERYIILKYPHFSWLCLWDYNHVSLIQIPRFPTYAVGVTNSLGEQSKEEHWGMFHTLWRE